MDSRFFTIPLLAVLLPLNQGPRAWAASIPPTVQANGSLRLEVESAITRGTRWLRARQTDSGAWSEERTPALSALALLAIERSGLSHHPEEKAAMEKGFRFLRSQAKADGGIYAEGLSNYNTAISLLALLQHNDPTDQTLTRKAHDFLVHQQASQMIRPELDGGIGYGPTGVSPKRQHPDLDNTVVSLEALRAYELAEKAREQPPSLTSLDWKAAIAFISRCQNVPETNPQPWVSISPSERGGFVYYPGFSNAGEIEEEGGRKALRSSGTMSYAGLLSFIYADLPKDDPRLKAALGWLQNNYTLAENPGLGKQGLFYYYHLMSKALAATGSNTFEARGKIQNWSHELGIALINRQEADGYWVNDTGRWMEKDPVLVTAYSLLTLEMLLSHL